MSGDARSHIAGWAFSVKYTFCCDDAKAVTASDLIVPRFMKRSTLLVDSVIVAGRRGRNGRRCHRRLGVEWEHHRTPSGSQ